jgi:iron complex outermembrane receptor protein
MDHRHRRGRLLPASLLATSLALAGTAPAAEPTAPDAAAPESAYFDEMPEVLAGSRLPQRLDASPVAISIIDRELIEASGAREIEDVLRLAPGMLVGHHDGSTAFVTYHAFADRYARRMQVLIDGRSVYSPAFGGVDWSALPITVDDIERIEVVRGPNAAAYGANAFLGTISITTRRGTTPTAVEAVVRKGQGDVDDLRLTAEHVADRWAARVTASQWSDDGFEPLNLWLDSERTDLVNARFDVDLGEGGALLVEAGLSDGWRSAGRPTRRPDPPHDRTVGSAYYNVRWSNALSADSEVTVALFDAQEESEEIYDTLTLGAGSAPYNGRIGAKDYSAESRRTDLEVQHVIRFDESLRAVYGASARVDRVRSLAWLGTTAERRNTLYRAFGHAEWQATEDWLLNAGFMYEDTEITDPGLAPRLTATYALARGHTLRVGASEATRTPVIVEQFADQTVTYDPGALVDQVLLSTNVLRPETILSYEIAYLGSFPQQRLTLDLRAFQDDVDHLITYVPAAYPDPDGGTLDFDNTDHADLTGIEGQLDWRPRDDLRLMVNYSYTNSVSSQHAERYHTSTPAEIASLLAIKRFGELEASLGVYWRTPFHGLDALDPVDEHARVDARVALPVGPRGSRARLEFVVQALEGRHLDSRDDFAFDPRAIVELSVGF